MDTRRNRARMRDRAERSRNPSNHRWYSSVSRTSIIPIVSFKIQVSNLPESGHTGWATVIVRPTQAFASRTLDGFWTRRCICWLILPSSASANTIGSWKSLYEAGGGKPTATSGRIQRSGLLSRPEDGRTDRRRSVSRALPSEPDRGGASRRPQRRQTRICPEPTARPAAP